MTSKKTATIFKSFALVLLACLMVGALSACSSDDSNANLTEGMILVVYDGTPGFLGNKTKQVRKLYVNENSILPAYLAGDDYTSGKTISSFGTATYSGYTLMGWYLDIEGAGTYTADESGDYVYLSGDNGIYSISPDGEWVLVYVADEDGTYVQIVAEEPPANEDAEEGEDPYEDVYYVFIEGVFEVYDDTNTAHLTSETAYGKLSHSVIYEAVGDAYAAYLSYHDELSASLILYFAEMEEALEEAAREEAEEDEEVVVPPILTKYSKEYTTYTEAYEGNTRYDVTAGYADLSFIMVANTAGEYVYAETGYELYDATNPAHESLTRYSVGENYKFVSTTEVPSISYLTRYSASFNYWNFNTDRVTLELYQRICAEKGYSEEDGFITLKAHWSAKPTVKYHLPDGSVTTVTTKMNASGTGSVNLVKGETIGRIQTIPSYAGQTFVGWSKSATEYIPWDFESDIFPRDAVAVNLYAYMLEGEYTRITTATQLARIGENPNGNYLLCASIDLGGRSYSCNSKPSTYDSTSPTANPNHPLGLYADVVFTGNFVAMDDCTISNYSMTVENPAKQIAIVTGEATARNVGLIPCIQGAYISNVTLTNVTMNVTTSMSSGNRLFDFNAALLVGNAIAPEEEGEENVVLNCNVSGTFVPVGTGSLGCNINIGGIIAAGTDNCTFVEGEGADDNTSSFTNEGIITTGTLTVSEK